jgi:hypothetical protein
MRRQATPGINVSIDEGVAIETSCFARMVPTRDIEEGMSVWLEQELERLGARRFPKKRSKQGLMVGATGIEPVTPTMSKKRAG